MAYVRKGEVIGGGYFVASRSKKLKRYQTVPVPFEHPSLEAAKLEKKRLEGLFPNKSFFILKALKA